MNDGKSLPTKYDLEIYEANSARDVCVHFSSNTPFLSVAKGDIINPSLWPNSEAPMKVLEVVSVEHMIWEIEGSHITHKICVFTKELENTEELRLEGNSIKDLTIKDRLALSNQFHILEKLYPDEANYYEKHRKALENGYKLHYSWMTENLYEEMSEAKCRFVLDVLDMFSALKRSYQKIEDKNVVNEHYVTFQGFDGNNEGEYMSYTRYFITDLNRFSNLREDSDDYFNSHFPSINKYEKMLAKWKCVKDKYNLTKEDMLVIINKS